MQYAPTLDRAALVELTIQRYFGSIDGKDLAGVLDCFQDEALLTVQTSFATHAGKLAIGRMFADLFRNWDTLVHREFTVTVDSLNGRIAASFDAVLTDASGRVTSLHNTGFWRVRNGRFQEIHVYMSGPNMLV